MKCPTCHTWPLRAVGLHWECNSCGWVGPNLDLRKSVRREHRPPHVRGFYGGYAGGGGGGGPRNHRVYAFVAMLMDPPEMTELTLRAAAPHTPASTIAYFLDKSVRMWPIADELVKGELQRIQQETR